MRRVFRPVAACALLIAMTSVLAAQAPTRIHGTITAVDGATIRIAPRAGGDAVATLGPSAGVIVASPTTLDAVTPGSFIGTAAQTQDDGTMVAVEVHVFPESMRGAGEGHRPFDLGPKSTMTNGTVGQEVVGKAGQTLTVTYKGGEKQIVVPPNAPVVAFAPGDAALLVKGAHVIAFLRKAADGSLTAANVLVGKDGYDPPL